MDFKEKLEIAANEAFADSHYGGIFFRMFTKAFKQGAEWLQSQPIADRLTEGEREKIKKLYNSEVYSMVLENRRIKESHNPTVQIKHECNWWQAKMKTDMLEQIFGKEMFENEE